MIDRSNQTSVVFEQALDLAEKDEACLMIFYCFTEVMLEPLIESGTGLDWYQQDVGVFHPLETEIMQTQIEGIKQFKPQK